MEKQLAVLVKMLPGVQVIGKVEKTITDLTADSRVVQPGSLFICLVGAHVDGHQYLAKAAAQGAVAALVQTVPAEVPAGLTLLKVAERHPDDVVLATESPLPVTGSILGIFGSMLGIAQRAESL